MMFEAYYNNVYAQKLHNNVQEVLRDVNKTPIPDDLQLKLDNFSIKSGIPVNALVSRINNPNCTDRHIFAKDPGRQRLAEKQQVSYFNQRVHRFHLQLLPNQNNYIWSNGQEFTKTIDALLYIKQDNPKETLQGMIRAFVFMRCIKENGGSQENSKREAEAFIRIIQEDPQASNEIFVIVIDDFSIPSLNRYQSLVKPENKHRIHITDSNNFHSLANNNII